MTCKRVLPFVVAGAMALLPPPTPAQTNAILPPTAGQPAFEVASIKPLDPTKGGVAAGFFSYPGGRVKLGAANLPMLLYFGYGVQGYQISGAPAWANSERYQIEAVPPDSSPSRGQKVGPYRIAPTNEQRQMIQSLLRDRYHLQFHVETKQGEVYILSRGTKKLQLQEPRDPDADWRGAVTMKSGGIVDGEAFGFNISMTNLASQLSRSLGLPVLDQTGLTGTYDFHLDPVDAENHDIAAGVFGCMDRLGLKLKRGTGPIETVVIDHIERPSEN